MDEGVQRENGMHKTDHYKHAHMQWMESDPHSHSNNYMKESMKIMALIAERDSAFQEMNIAFAEKKAALAERDMAFLQRDAAISDRNSAVSERDKALAALHHHQQQNHQLNPQQNQYFHPELYNNNNNDSYDNGMNKSKRGKRNPKEPKKREKASQNSTRVKNEEWRDQQHTGLNQVSFDETNMPVPVCSCTGNYHQCYKWGEGGWQSSCCTLTMSVHPLPVMANKKHARMSGRKMSGSVFKRLLSRLAAEGCDLSLPVDLKDHWSRHGTNRYITIK